MTASRCRGPSTARSTVGTGEKATMRERSRCSCKRERNLRNSVKILRSANPCVRFFSALLGADRRAPPVLLISAVTQSVKRQPSDWNNRPTGSWTARQAKPPTTCSRSPRSLSRRWFGFQSDAHIVALCIRLPFSVGKSVGTPRMRSHTVVHLPTTNFFVKPFVLKNEIEKKDLQEMALLAWAQGVAGLNPAAPTTFHLCLRPLNRSSVCRNHNPAQKTVLRKTVQSVSPRLCYPGTPRFRWRTQWKSSGNTQSFLQQRFWQHLNSTK